MSVRLSVLLVQSSRMSGLQSGINAELVFQLMGVPGIDLSIVNSISPAEIAATDRLLLSSLETDLAVLDWRDPDESIAALDAVGITGHRSPHQIDPTASPANPGQRRLYLVDLRRGDSVAEVVDAMKQLLNQRRVVAVPLGIGILPKSQPPTQASVVSVQSVRATQNSAAPEAATSVHRPTVVEVATANLPTVAVASPQAETRPIPSPPPTASGPSDQDLDALVDGLNAADW